MMTFLIRLFSLLKKKRIIIFLSVAKLDTVIRNDIRHQSREFDLASTVYCNFVERPTYFD